MCAAAGTLVAACASSLLCAPAPRDAGELDIQLAQLHWAALHDVIAAYGFAVTLWMNGMPVPRLLLFRFVAARILAASRRQ